MNVPNKIAVIIQILILEIDKIVLKEKKKDIDERTDLQGFFQS